MIDEARRHRLFEAALELFGEEEAATLMEHLPPVGWADVATRHHVDTSMALLRSELAVQTAELRGEMAGLRDELRGEMTELRDELRGDMGDLRSAIADLRVDMTTQFREQGTRLMAWTIPTWMTAVGLSVTVAVLA